MSGQNLLLLSAVQQAISDPYFEYTTLLLPGNGTNGAQNNTFLDSSTNAFSITRNGNTTQGTFSPFSQTGWSNYFDGTGDYLSVADNTALDISGQFTWECWVYFSSISGSSDNILYSKLIVTPSVTGLEIGVNTTGKFYVWINGSVVITSTSSVSAGQWVHLAASRDGSNNVRIFINGTSAATAVSNSADTSTSASVILGANYAGSARVTGYISNFRLVKGTAVYTANFTPSTTPLTAITNTSLLTCQSNRFIDNSTNAFAITRNGDVSVQAFSPFNPTAAWSAATNGGSGYFDGSGDYVSAATASALQLTNAVAWTIEFWFYANAMSTQQFLLHGYDPNSPYTGYGIGLGTNGNPNTTLAFWDGTTWRTIATGLTPSQWYHVAISYEGSGTTGRMFLNGTQQGSAFAPASTINNTSNAIAWGAQNNNILHLNGYISGARIVKGTAVYTASFTAPTAPPTAITNTSLLLNFTNAGIYDATSKNDLETVGNAQISTTQSKFGGSSMYFDGTGDYLYRAANPNPLGSGDWTIEFWYYQSGGSSYRAAVSTRTAADGGTTATVFCGFFGNNMYYDGSTSGGINVVGSTTIVNATWYHCAYVRSGSTVTLYLNGVSQGSVSDSNNKSNPDVWVGGQNTLYYLNGYINDLRITKGIARYTSNFTPPTTAFPLL